MSKFQIESKRDFDELIVALRSGRPTLEECFTAANALERAAHVLLNWHAAMQKVSALAGGRAREAVAATEEPTWAARVQRRLDDMRKKEEASSDPEPVKVDVRIDYEKLRDNKK